MRANAMALAHLLGLMEGRRILTQRARVARGKLKERARAQTFLSFRQAALITEVIILPYTRWLLFERASKE